IKSNAVAALRSRLLPLATVVTPNLPEAEQISGMKLRTWEEIEAAARQIVALGAKTVIIKGGHRKGPAVDLFFDGKEIHALDAPRIRTKNTHGTGCTLSAAIAAYLAKGENIESAVRAAKKYITAAIRAGFTVGAGHSPVHHFYKLWKA
ncbi:MAG TPA: PfkB family carbohydrate kinase, partial [Candidatus Binatia bacterium]|nr:PfkB family carbohydrate kinase [Candidatus Binatia bacterium]